MGKKKESDPKFTFRFGNEDQHRLDQPTDLYVGYGWLKYKDASAATFGSYVSASDFLFTATPIPEPATIAMLGALIMALGLHHTRKRRKQLA
ncbi:MAG: hypothetical protein AAGB46_07245 [Verrucomicrobiota bacterium]